MYWVLQKADSEVEMIFKTFIAECYWTCGREEKEAGLSRGRKAMQS
jgi:hypothetical protein